MSFNPRQPMYSGYDFGFGQMITEEQFKYLYPMHLLQSQHYFNQPSFGMAMNYMHSSGEMNRSVPQQQPFTSMQNYAYYPKPQFQFGNGPVHQVAINQQQNVVRRLQNSTRTNAVIIISDDDENEARQLYDKEPSPVTELRRQREEHQKTVKNRKEKQIRKVHQIIPKPLQQKKKPRKKIQYLNNGQRKSNRQIKLKTVQSNNEQLQERHRQQLAGKSRVGNQFQTDIPSLFTDIREKQLWIGQKKSQLFKRHLN